MTIGIEDFYKGYRISDVIKENAVILNMENTVQDAVAEMMEMSVNSVIIAENGIPVGILTGKDVSRLISKGEDISSIKLRDEMDHPVPIVEVEASVYEAVRIMTEKEIHKAVVVDEKGIMTGIVSLSYLFRMLEQENKRFVKELVAKKEKTLLEKAVTLEERLAELSAIYDNSPVLMILVDRQRRVQKVNYSAVRFTGRAAEEMIGLRDGEALRCMHSADDPRGCGFGEFCQSCTVRRIVQDTFETGKARSKVEARLSLALEDEDVFFLVSTAFLALPQGEMVLLCIEDIPYRKGVEEVLRASEEKLRMIFKNSPVGISCFDRNSIITECNNKLAEILGAPKEKIIGVNMKAALRDEKEKAALEAALSGGMGRFEGDSVSVTGGKLSTIKTIYSALISGNGSILGGISITEDISERREAEERLMAVLNEKEVLLREVNHRVKKNLQLIYSLLNLQKEHATNKEFLDMIEEYQNRIRAISLVHESLYQSEDLSNINIRNYINGLASRLFRYYEVESSWVIMSVDIEDISLEVSYAIPFGLIVSELVADSLQHSCPNKGKSEIKIIVRSIDEKGVELVMSTSCMTMPCACGSIAQGSFGQQVVEILVKHLKGEMKIEKDGGTKLYIKFRREK